MRDAVKSVAVAAMLLLLFWLLGMTVSALADSAANTPTDFLFRVSDDIGGALCRVFGL